MHICEYLCDGTDGPLPPSLNFEPFELDCHCIPPMMVFFLGYHENFAVFLFVLWAEPLVV